MDGYIARSVLQVAIRREDIPLLKHAFDIIWDTSFHREWLKRKIVFLVLEDIWYVLGEVPKLLSLDAKGAEEKNYWKKFICRLAVLPKNKDVYALNFLYLHRNTFIHKVNIAKSTELRYVFNLLDKITDITPLETIAHNMYKEYIEKTSDYSEYELNAAKLLQQQILGTAAYGEKCLCLIAIRLMTMRYITSYSVNKLLKEKIAEYRLYRSKPNSHLPQQSCAEIQIPWYAYDNNTKIGRKILLACMKEFNLSALQIKRLYYLSITGAIYNCYDCYTVDYSKRKECPEAFESMWWQAVLHHVWALLDISVSKDVTTIKDQLDFFTKSKRIAEKILKDAKIC
jgi:hypothetical protein